jgi:hypothetical protein
VVALRHLAPQGEELAALGHPHEDICIFHAELAELVRNRFICHAEILTQLLSRESESSLGIEKAERGRVNRRSSACGPSAALDRRAVF